MFWNILVGLLFQIAGYYLAPKEKQELPTTDDLEEPEVESRPIPRVTGSVTITSPQIIGAWDKAAIRRKPRDTGGKK